MLTGKDAIGDARILDDLAKGKDGDSPQIQLLRGIVKGVSLVVKLLVTVRGNQVAIMKKTGVELRQPEDRGKDKTDNDETTK
ncbi:MAG TPA: hypothetical protein VMZ91_16335 [Candidatus Paceibacterota bacterium]|nr:hypothetical protein [Candidatus Paceibacterota bacterium]